MNGKFELGQIVYHVADEMQEMRIVTGIVQRSNGINYMAASKDGELEYFDIELSSEKQIF